MEDIFKQNLLRLRKPQNPSNFGEALFPSAYWPKIIPQRKNIPETTSFTERKQVLESLERFAVEKTAELSTPVLKVEGGEIALKSDSWESVAPASNLDELKRELSLDAEFLELMFKGKNSPAVLFVTENFRPWDEVKGELRGGFIDELMAAFPPKTAELFERMVLAMKLLPQEVLLYPVEGTKDMTSEVLKVCAYFRPQVVVTLGAKATQKILKGQNRLSVVHGQFFKKNLPEVGTFQVVPLFHPSIIETNQNMKKTAWADMQKIMKFLKKLP